MQFFTKTVPYVKQLFYPTDVYASQRFVLFSSLIFGLLPYRLVNKHGRLRLQTSIFGFIVAISYMIFFGACFMSTIIYQQNLMEYFVKSSISNFGGNLNLITSFLSITSVYLSSLCLRKNLKKMLDILTVVDGKFIELGIEINHRRALAYNIKSSFLALIACSMFVICSTTFLLQMDRHAGDNSRLSVIVTHFMPYNVITALILTFLNFTRLILARFNAANQVSRWYISNIFFYRQKRENRSSPHKNAMVKVKKFNQLCFLLLDPQQTLWTGINEKLQCQKLLRKSNEIIQRITIRIVNRSTSRTEISRSGQRCV